MLKTNINDKAIPNKITQSIRPFLLRSSIALMLGGLSLTTYAIPTEEHGSADVDTTAPIVALDRLQSVKNVDKLEFELPTIHHFTTDNGVPVSFVRTTEIPIVDVDIRFNAGSARDEAIREGGFGIANMTATMLMQGTQSLDEDEFAATTEQLGVALSSSAHRDMFVVSMRSLSDKTFLDLASRLMQDLLVHPRFDTEVLERNKARLALGIQQQQQSPGYIANLAFMQALYNDHPYAHPTSGTLESVPTLTRDDLVKFHDTFIVANNANISITGDMSIEEAKMLANRLTAQLPRGNKPPALSKPATLSESQRIDIPFDSTQTTVLIGQIGDKRSTDSQEIQDQTNFSIGNYILAGSDFSARLMSEIRKNRGLTYGISGDMTLMQVEGPYVIGFSTRQDKVEEAIDVSLKIIEDTIENGVTEEELALTKESFINSYPMGFTSNASINGTIAATSFYDLPDEYLTDYLNRVENVDLQRVNTSLKETLNPDSFLIVTVGQQDYEQPDASQALIENKAAVQ